MGRKRQISQAESQIISADPGHQGGGASPPRQPWAVLRASFPKAWGRGEEEKKDFAGGNRTVRTQPGDGVSPGGSHSDSRHPETTQGLWAFTSVVSSPKPRAQPLWGERHQTDSTRGTSCRTPAWPSSKTEGHQNKGSLQNCHAERRLREM